MTLLINDICTRGDLREGYILTVADRRISYPKGHKKHYKPEHKTKIFKIPKLNATIGYFGLAYYRSNIQHNPTPLSSWVTSFIDHHYEARSIGEFAGMLCEKLNSYMEKKDVEKGITGFHICGYNHDDIPEFWVVRNIGDDYSQPCQNYYECREKFLSRDAANAGYDGVTPDTGLYKHTFYINGDPEPFHRIWFPLSEFVDGMIQRGGFGRQYSPLALKNDEDIRKIAEWQMKVIGGFYSKFGNKGKKIVGGPADAIIVRPKNQLPKRVAVFLQDGPVSGWVYDLNDKTADTVRVLIEFMQGEGRVHQRITFAEVVSESYMDFSRYSYYRRTGHLHDGMPVFALCRSSLQ